MFGRRHIDFTPSHFWGWFAREAHGLANALEALARGEADADASLAILNAQIRRVDALLEADLVRDLDGHCHLTMSGPEAALAALLATAPRLAGWRVSAREATADARRIPFRLAPRPSLDRLGDVITGRYEAYIV